MKYHKIYPLYSTQGYNIEAIISFDRIELEGLVKLINEILNEDAQKVTLVFESRVTTEGSQIRSIYEEDAK